MFCDSHVRSKKHGGRSGVLRDPARGVETTPSLPFVLQTVEGLILEKPMDKQDAYRMLSRWVPGGPPVGDVPCVTAWGGRRGHGSSWSQYVTTLVTLPG